MNKRFLLFLSYALITIQSFAATVDTLYYDDKWKGVYKFRSICGQ